MVKQKQISAPLYKKIQDQLIDMISDEGLRPGDKIPSERELAENLMASRMTIRHGVDELVKIGILERQSTKGTFIRSTQIERQIGRTSRLGLSQLLKANGVEPSSRLLGFEIKLANNNLASKLKISLDEEIVVIERLREADGLPFCIEKSHIPHKYVPGINQEYFTKKASLYELLKNKYGIEITGGEQSLSISYTTAEEALILDIEPGTPIMIIQTVAHDADFRPIEFMKGINHPNKVVFKTHSMLDYEIE